jgi:hypothetical protein
MAVDVPYYEISKKNKYVIERIEKYSTSTDKENSNTNSLY